MQAVNKFNETLLMFLSETSALLSAMKEPAAKTVLADIAYAHSKLDGMLMIPGVDKKAALKMFAQHMLPFSKKIQEKDSSFFLEDLPRQPWLNCDAKLGSLFANTCQQNQDQIWEYLTYLLFLAEGVSTLPDDQLEMVDALVEKMQNDPDAAMQDVMKLMQEASDSVGGAGQLGDDPMLAAWGPRNGVDDMFAAMAAGVPAGDLRETVVQTFVPNSPAEDLKEAVVRVFVPNTDTAEQTNL